MHRTILLQFINYHCRDLSRRSRNHHEIASTLSSLLLVESMYNRVVYLVHDLDRSPVAQCPVDQ